jgi:hypothetical protein
LRTPSTSRFEKSHNTGTKRLKVNTMPSAVDSIGHRVEIFDKVVIFHRPTQRELHVPALVATFAVMVQSNAGCDDIPKASALGNRAAFVPWIAKTPYDF